MKTYWIYGYGGDVQPVTAACARDAAKRCDFAIAVVRNSAGAALTPDLWA